jgi:hypothetical protein
VELHLYNMEQASVSFFLRSSISHEGAEFHELGIAALCAPSSSCHFVSDPA